MESSAEYKILIKKHTPKSKSKYRFLTSFAVGGAICFSGQWITYLFIYIGAEEKSAYLYTTLFFIALGSLLTSLGIFDKIAARSGAGTLVPVTGFANAVTSSAIDTGSEGYVGGVGSKIFTVAGPVILYSALSGVLYGLVYFLTNLFI